MLAGPFNRQMVLKSACGMIVGPRARGGSAPGTCCLLPVYRIWQVSANSQSAFGGCNHLVGGIRSFFDGTEGIADGGRAVTEHAQGRQDAMRQSVQVVAPFERAD